jgi:hypothetical protein
MIIELPFAEPFGHYDKRNGKNQEENERDFPEMRKGKQPWMPNEKA